MDKKNSGYRKIENTSIRELNKIPSKFFLFNLKNKKIFKNISDTPINNNRNNYDKPSSNSILNLAKNNTFSMIRSKSRNSDYGKNQYENKEEYPYNLNTNQSNYSYLDNKDKNNRIIPNSSSTTTINSENFYDNNYNNKYKKDQFNNNNKNHYGNNNEDNIENDEDLDYYYSQSTLKRNFVKEPIFSTRTNSRLKSNEKNKINNDYNNEKDSEPMSLMSRANNERKMNIYPFNKNDNNENNNKAYKNYSNISENNFMKNHNALNNDKSKMNNIYNEDIKNFNSHQKNKSVKPFLNNYINSENKNDLKNDYDEDSFDFRRNNNNREKNYEVYNSGKNTIKNVNPYNNNINYNINKDENNSNFVYKSGKSKSKDVYDRKLSRDEISNRRNINLDSNSNNTNNIDDIYSRNNQNYIKENPVNYSFHTHVQKNNSIPRQYNYNNDYNNYQQYDANNYNNNYSQQQLNTEYNNNHNNNNNLNTLKNSISDIDIISLSSPIKPMSRQNSAKNLNNSIYSNTQFNPNYNNTFQSQRSYNNTYEVLINLEDLLMVELKLYDILNAITKSEICYHECFDWWNLYINSSLYGNFENLFKNITDKGIIKDYINIEMICACLIYDSCFEIEYYDNINYIMKSLFEIFHENYLILCDFILSKISLDSIENFWVKKLEEHVQTNLKIKNLRNRHLLEIKENNKCAIDFMMVIFNDFPNKDISNPLLTFLNNLYRLKSSTLNDFFRSKIIRVENKNASNLASSLITENDNSENIEIKAPYVDSKPSKEYCLVLDLDETLIHFKIDYDDDSSGTLRMRPGLFKFLDSMEKVFEIMIFTAATRDVNFFKI
jgi:hypothetical protein